mmetsp:Transcript_66821/g.106235  ORF Transcript_66821/g.106235 Transcript_66821/m.106235 type:complete len:229 (+) Transcript_66821:1538-2224(+)
MNHCSISTWIRRHFHIRRTVFLLRCIHCFASFAFLCSLSSSSFPIMLLNFGASATDLELSILHQFPILILLPCFKVTHSIHSQRRRRYKRHNIVDVKRTRAWSRYAPFAVLSLSVHIKDVHSSFIAHFLKHRTGFVSHRQYAPFSVNVRIESTFDIDHAITAIRIDFGLAHPIMLSFVVNQPSLPCRNVIRIITVCIDKRNRLIVLHSAVWLTDLPSRSIALCVTHKV